MGIRIGLHFNGWSHNGWRMVTDFSKQCLRSRTPRCYSDLSCDDCGNKNYWKIDCWVGFFLSMFCSWVWIMGFMVALDLFEMVVCVKGNGREEKTIMRGQEFKFCMNYC
jgi:fatty-acid desaturase